MIHDIIMTLYTLQEVTMPTAFSPELRELLTGLLQKDTGKRLACLGAGLVGGRG